MIECILIGYSLFAFAAMYRWKDANGQVHYSSALPTQGVVGAIEVKRGNNWYPYSSDDTSNASPENPQNPVLYTTSSPNAISTPTPIPAEIVINYQQQNAAIIIPVTLNNTFTTLFIVDTGATYTVLSREAAAKLLLTPGFNAPQVTLQTANGNIQAPLVNLQSIAVGNMITPNVTAAIHDFHETSGISGLLGLSFLNRFKMTVDATNHQLTLVPLQPPSAHQNSNCVAAMELFQQGQALKNGSESEAAYYRKAIALCRDLIEAYYALGVIYIQHKDARRAIELHRDILQMQSDNPEAHFRLGVSYILDRQFEQAAQELHETLRLNPNHRQAREYLNKLNNF